MATSDELHGLLFSDIEGSTERWNLYLTAMEAALQRHDHIMRTSIEMHQGVVFKTIGDAFCSVFSDVAQALEAAIDAQRLLATETFSAVDGLRVRMAVHVGRLEARDGDYFGPAVNCVARLLSAGHGGQILLSGDAADAIEEHLPENTRLRSLGMIQLKGFLQPQRVFQIAARGVPSAFKPLRAFDVPRNNIPRALTSFVGRQVDVARLAALVKANSLTTVVGTGGVGKTRLALEVACNMLEESRDGVWIVELASLSDSNLVASGILSAVGGSGGAPNVIDALTQYLKPRELLLVLDNCEHVLDRVVLAASAILSSCPKVTILATSREPLSINGETIYRLSSLTKSDAIELFADRATASDSTFHLGDQNRQIVTEICDWLDGIALALELAAARLRAIPLDQLLNRLHLRILEGGPRNVPSRQQTMYAVIDWSYELLSAQEKTFFSIIATFAGGFTFDAASKMSGADPLDVSDLLTSLVDKSLLSAHADGGERYRLLQPIREFAMDRLRKREDAQAVFARHALTFSEIATDAYNEWDRSPAPDWLARIRREIDNLRTALEWVYSENHDYVMGGTLAGSAGLVFLRLSYLQEGVKWCERALEFCSPLESDKVARIYYVLSMLYHNQGSNQEALAAARYAAAHYRDIQDERGLVRALSQIAHHLKDPAQARSIAEDAVIRARTTADPRLLATTLQRCAFVYPPGEIELATAYFEEAVALFRSLRRNDETARALTAWADALSLCGNFERSTIIATEALALTEGDERVYVVIALASLHIALGDIVKATPYVRESIGILSRIPHPIATPLVLYCAAAIVSETEMRDAARLLGYADARLEERSWSLSGSDCVVRDKLVCALQRSLSKVEFNAEVTAGKSLNEQEALAAAHL